MGENRAGGPRFLRQELVNTFLSLRNLVRYHSLFYHKEGRARRKRNLALLSFHIVPKELGGKKIKETKKPSRDVKNRRDIQLFICLCLVFLFFAASNWTISLIHHHQHSHLFPALESTQTPIRREPLKKILAQWKTMQPLKWR